MFALLMLFGLSGLASAQTSEVRIESFYYTGTTQNRTAEVCGGVYPPPAAVSYVTVTVDPDSKNSALYTAATSRTGKFCLIVMTFTGRASADIAGLAQSAVVQAKTRQ